MLQNDSIAHHNVTSGTNTQEALLLAKKKKIWMAQYRLKMDSIARADSVHRVDSIHRIDSIARVDSIHRTDSLRLVAEKNRGIPGSNHPYMVHNNEWMFGFLLLLFFLLVFALSRTISTIPEKFKTFFKVNERAVNQNRSTILDYLTRFSMLLFVVGTLSTIAYLGTTHPENTFSLFRFAKFGVVTLAFVAFKFMMIDFIGYIFFARLTTQMAKESYFYLLSAMGMVLFPLVLIYIYSSSLYLDITLIITAIILAITYILVIIKLFQIFFHRTVAYFYILLYLCTLEILPLIILYQVYHFLV